MNDFIKTIQSFERLFACHICAHGYTTEVKEVLTFLEIGNHVNLFCNSVKKYQKDHKQCVFFDREIVQQQIARSRKPLLKLCHADALELVIPIIINNTLAGSLFFGPFKKEKAASYSIHNPLEQGSNHNLNVDVNRNKLAELPLTKIDDLMRISQLFVEKIAMIIEEQDSRHEATNPQERIIHYIKNHFKENITLGDLAEHLDLCESRTTQLLRMHFDTSFPRLLNKTRIKYAKTLLENTYMTLETIALECGFRDAPYFHRVFKKQEAMTPKHYRKSTRKSINQIDA